MAVIDEAVKVKGNGAFLSSGKEFSDTARRHGRKRRKRHHSLWDTEGA